MLHTRPPRLYNGGPARTRQISSTIRVPVNLQPLSTITKQPGSRAHQCGVGVFRFEPNPNFKCCKARCMSHFLTDGDNRVVEARRPLYDPLLSVAVQRLKLRDNWTRHLRFAQSDGSSRRVCLTCACKIYVCSRAKLCPQPTTRGDIPGRTKGESNAARAVKNVSISAWFHSLMETLDIMPDTGYYQTQYGKKYMLHEAYLLDVGCWPAIYTRCNQSYFNVVWRESFPQSCFGNIVALQNVNFVLTKGTSFRRLPGASLKSRTKGQAHTSPQLGAHARAWLLPLQKGRGH